MSSLIKKYRRQERLALPAPKLEPKFKSVVLSSGAAILMMPGTYETKEWPTWYINFLAQLTDVDQYQLLEEFSGKYIATQNPFYRAIRFNSESNMTYFLMRFS